MALMRQMMVRSRVKTSDRISYHLIQGTEGPLVVCPPDAEGHREAITILQAHARLLEKLNENDGMCDGPACDACDLADLLNGIR